MTNNDELALKPGTYAILFRDNWDGQGDVYKTLATLSDDLVWYHHENGRSLIEYEGDEVLKVWPLDDGSNVLALLAERDADKKVIADSVVLFETLRQRVAELEARTVSVKLPTCVDDLHGVGMVMSADAVVEALAAAGIKLEVGE